MNVSFGTKGVKMVFGVAPVDFGVGVDAIDEFLYIGITITVDVSVGI